MSNAANTSPSFKSLLRRWAKVSGQLDRAKGERAYQLEQELSRLDDQMDQQLILEQETAIG